MNDATEGLGAERNFGDYYHQIYARGFLANEQPTLPVSWAELERRAAEEMEPRAASYVFGGAGTEDTMRVNLEAFRRWRIVPRMLRQVTDRELRTDVLGTDMPAPLLLAPIGVQTLVHPEGEIASARAAGALGVPFVVSTAAATSLEDVAEANGDAPRWYQLYWPSNDEITASIVRRAEAAGYSALVLTVDNYVPGWKPRDLQQAYLPFLEGIGIAQFTSDPVFRAGLEKSPEEDIGAAVGQYLSGFVNPNQTWERLSWLRETTRLPILLKGILHPDDAREASRRGVDGIIVSNHGGRQLDGAIAALDALAGVVDAVGGRLDDPVRQRHPQRCGRLQGHRARRRRRPARPPLSLGPRARGPVRCRDRPANAARRARPDDGVEWRHARR